MVWMEKGNLKWSCKRQEASIPASCWILGSHLNRSSADHVPSSSSARRVDRCLSSGAGRFLHIVDGGRYIRDVGDSTAPSRVPEESRSVSHHAMIKVVKHTHKPEEGLVDAAACFLSRSSRAKTSAVSAPEEYMFPAPPLPVEIKPEGPRDRDREVEMLPTPPRPVER